MENLKKINWLVLPAALAVLLAAGALWKGRLTAAVVAFVLLLLSAAAMVLLLRRRMKTAFYSYLNVALAGGILFNAVLAAELIALLAESRGAGFTARALLETAVAFPRKFSYYAVAFISLISLVVCVSNLALIRHEGFRPGNLLGILLGLFYIGGTAALYFVTDNVTEVLLTKSAGAIAAGTGISLFLLTMLCYLECIFLGLCFMSARAAKRIPSFDKDYIIILGCSIDKKGGLLPLLKGRVNRAVKFAWEQEIATGKTCRYVPSGGQGSNEIMSEGSAMELYLLSHGAEEDEVFPERQSVNTLENFLFSKRIIDELQPGASIAFSTTNYHVFRSGLLAREAGFDAEGIAAGTKWYFWPNGFIREFFAVLSMKKTAHLKVAAVIAAFSAAAGILCSGLI